MNEPLAQRMRPKTLAEVCGQQHLLAPGRVFRRTIESGRIPNMIFTARPARQDHRGPHHCREQRHDVAQAQRNFLRHGDIKAVLKDIGTLAGAGASCCTSMRSSI